MKNKNEVPIYLFHQGTNYYSYKFLGAHIDEDSSGTFFRVWAPKAKSVHVVGDFNKWQKDKPYEMNLISDGGIWEVFIPKINAGQLYKYLITTGDNQEL